jgi:hypothetical protein
MKSFTQDFDILRVFNFFPQGNKSKHKVEIQQIVLEGVCSSTIQHLHH